MKFNKKFDDGDDDCKTHQIATWWQLKIVIIPMDLVWITLLVKENAQHESYVCVQSHTLVLVCASLFSTMVLLFKRSMAYGVISFCKVTTYNIFASC